MSERLQLETSDGTTLEARIDSPDQPERMTVFCHPHPLQGGSMNAPLMIAVATRLVERGHIVLRFNFRGTGSSSGEHEFGAGEIDDVAAAVEHAKSHGLPLGIGGWSFGAWTALRWLAGAGSTMPYVGIAPPARDLPEELPTGPKRIILGTREQVVDSAALIAYAEKQAIDLVLTPGDHFFHGRGKRIGDLVGQGLEDA
ncbi:MAG TPA: CocE/NonD family hydrolase [Acidimicrobiia bacterium]|nr:CocE/NonD family hydrolase [Acidimicrobiia bacterium]